MIPISEIQAAGYDVAVSDKMINRIREWGEIYENNAPWLQGDFEKRITSLELPAGIASELARLILYKVKSWVTTKGGSTENSRSQWLQEQYSGFMKGLRPELELACAVGGMVFKPYIVNRRIYVDTIANDRFIPCAFDLEGNITEAVFLSTAVIGNKYYTRLECHSWKSDSRYKITNRVFSSSTSSTLGTECDFSEVPQWSGIEKIHSFKNVDQPLFAYFKLPIANNIDRNSTMGISCFSRWSIRSDKLTSNGNERCGSSKVLSLP